MITPGGEVGFVKRILSESLRLRERCGSVNSTSGYNSAIRVGFGIRLPSSSLFSSLLGKLSSLTEIVEELRIQAV